MSTETRLRDLETDVHRLEHRAADAEAHTALLPAMSDRLESIATDAAATGHQLVTMGLGREQQSLIADVQTLQQGQQRTEQMLAAITAHLGITEAPPA